MFINVSNKFYKGNPKATYMAQCLLLGLYLLKGHKTSRNKRIVLHIAIGQCSSPLTPGFIHV